MTGLLPKIMAGLKPQGNKQVADVVHLKNQAAGKVLGRSGFVYHAAFDRLQDFYAYKASA